jgi:hypothetical protein
MHAVKQRCERTATEARRAVKALALFSITRLHIDMECGTYIETRICQTAALRPESPTSANLEFRAKTPLFPGLAELSKTERRLSSRLKAPKPVRTYHFRLVKAE